MIADIPTAVKGTEAITKYDMGANMVPARQSPSPNILYALLIILLPQIIVKDAGPKTFLIAAP